MKLSDIKEVASSQQSRLNSNTGMPRDILPDLLCPLEGFATIVSGIRRCGKSTLMNQVAGKMSEPYFYINFDTPKLNGFTLSDFELIDAIVDETAATSLFFDEIQIVPGWEQYVRKCLDEGRKVMATGSNASMLSRELGTRLTGRHITKELFTFSYSEYCRYLSLTPSAESLNGYLTNGGFPQYLKLKDDNIHKELLNDIIFRDIAVRYGIKDVGAMQTLLLYLVTNIGNLVSANKLTAAVNVKTAKTILEYFTYFVQSYILAFVPRYSYSYKAQLISPRKVYCIDNGLHMAVTTSATTDAGRRLENMVYGELRRRGSQVFYYNEGQGECDFVVCSANVPREAIQVCHTLDRNNEQRETEGLLAAMKALNLNSGKIITLNQKDTILKDGLRIEITPAWERFM